MSVADLTCSRACTAGCAAHTACRRQAGRVVAIANASVCVHTEKDCAAQAPEQELELPEDMTLDEDGQANADEAEGEGADAPEAEGDAPETFPEGCDADAEDGGGAEQADQDADMADQADAKDGAHAQAAPTPSLLSRAALSASAQRKV